MYTLKGEIKTIKDTRNVSDTFKVREFVITANDDKYPQVIAFQSSQDKCEMLNALKVGENVEVFFNLRGREWTSPQGDVRVFNTLDAWKVQTLNQAPQEAEKPADLPF
tara:strand:- start:409 stop:732 length:324 start_codon:yes stop_codon:yes gene_type:complete